MSPEAPRWSRGRIALVAVTIALVALLVWIGSHIRWNEQEIDLGYAKAAMRNPFLAAELFLRAQGVEAETVTGLGLLDDLPSRDDTLILASSRRSMSERRRADLMQWVESGGHLIVVAREIYDEARPERRDALLAHYDIQLLQIDPDEEDDLDEGAVGDDGDAADEGDSDDPSAATDDEAGDGEADGKDDDEELEPFDVDEVEADVRGFFERTFSGEPPECGEDEERLAYIDLSPAPAEAEPTEPFQEKKDDDQLAIDLDSDRVIWTPDRRGLTAYSGTGAQLVHRPIERGAITASTSLHFWLNQQIHCYDHAYLLWRFTSSPGKVWILYDPAVPTLTDHLRASFPLASASFFMLVLVWAASRSLRFGPPLPTEDPPRRELLEHLEASAHFLWQQGRIQEALTPLREDVLARAGRIDPRLRRPGPDAVDHIASLTHVARAEIETALLGHGPMKRREFSEIMRTLLAIRRQL